MPLINCPLSHYRDHLPQLMAITAIIKGERFVSTFGKRSERSQRGIGDDETPGRESRRAFIDIIVRLAAVHRRLEGTIASDR